MHKHKVQTLPPPLQALLGDLTKYSEALHTFSDSGGSAAKISHHWLADGAKGQQGSTLSRLNEPRRGLVGSQEWVRNSQRLNKMGVGLISNFKYWRATLYLVLLSRNLCLESDWGGKRGKGTPQKGLFRFNCIQLCKKKKRVELFLGKN